LRGAKRRSNPFFVGGSMDCFASLAMTVIAHSTLLKEKLHVSQ
jgi:hypothetical protein